MLERDFMFECVLYLNISVYSTINISGHLRSQRAWVLVGEYFMSLLTEVLTTLNNVITRYRYFVSLNVVWIGHCVHSVISSHLLGLLFLGINGYNLTRQTFLYIVGTGPEIWLYVWPFNVRIPKDFVLEW